MRMHIYFSTLALHLEKKNNKKFFIIALHHCCNTLGVKHAFGIRIAWGQASLIIHEHEHLKFYI